jgi:uncharacterized protein (TIGR03435 family)
MAEYDPFDVIALVPAGSSASDRNRMLRSLLIQRFGLMTHEDKKPLQVFALVPAKRGAQLKQSAAVGVARCSENDEPGPTAITSYTCRHTTMSDFGASPRMLDRSVTRPVADRTGLQRARDFSVRFTPLFDLQRAAAAGQASPGIKLFDALQMIGLRLESQAQVVPVLAVDRVNRNPTPNAPDVAAKLPAAPDAFEVAEVKPSPPGTEQAMNFRAGGARKSAASRLRS